MFDGSAGGSFSGVNSVSVSNPKIVRFGFWLLSLLLVVQSVFWLWLFEPVVAVGVAALIALGVLTRRIRLISIILLSTSALSGLVLLIWWQIWRWKESLPPGFDSFDIWYDEHRWQAIFVVFVVAVQLIMAAIEDGLFLAPPPDNDKVDSDKL